MASKETILIVEDETGPRVALEMILKPIYEILTASDGKNALNVIQNQNVDLVTLDLKMPGMSGIEVLQEIKKIQPGVEVVIITAEGNLSNAKKAIQYGASEFISKPFDVAGVLTVVRELLKRRTANLKLNKLIQQNRDSQKVFINEEILNV